MSSPDEEIAFLTKMLVFSEKNGIQSVALCFRDIALDVLHFGFWSWSKVTVSSGYSLSEAFVEFFFVQLLGVCRQTTCPFESISNDFKITDATIAITSII